MDELNFLPDLLEAVVNVLAFPDTTPATISDDDFCRVSILLVILLSTCMHIAHLVNVMPSLQSGWRSKVGLRPQSEGNLDTVGRRPQKDAVGPRPVFAVHVCTPLNGNNGIVGLIVPFKECFNLLIYNFSIFQYTVLFEGLLTSFFMIGDGVGVYTILLLSDCSLWLYVLSLCPCFADSLSCQSMFKGDNYWGLRSGQI